MAACEICKSTGAIEQTKNALISTSCDRCGLFVVTIEGQSTLSNNLVRVLQAPNVNENLRRARLSHIVRRGQRNGRSFHIPLKDVGTWNLDDPLPTPSEQFDNLVLWVGDHQPNYAQSVAIQAPEMAAWMGAPVNIGASEIIGWILQQQSGVGQLIEERVDALRLNLKGWERYYALKQTATDSRTAFMAMQFNNVQLDDVFESCFCCIGRWISVAHSCRRATGWAHRRPNASGHSTRKVRCFRSNSWKSRSILGGWVRRGRWKACHLHMSSRCLGWSADPLRYQSSGYDNLAS